MLDYKTMIRLRNMGLSFGAVAGRIYCKWETVQRIVTRCENEWGVIDAVPGDLSNEEIANALFHARKSIDTNYLQPDCEKVLEGQRRGKLRNRA